jgi:hypothetical protein
MGVLAIRTQQIQIETVVGVVKKHLLAAIAALGNMIRNLPQDNASDS